jgi:hypothetical protein
MTPPDAGVLPGFAVAVLYVTRMLRRIVVSGVVNNVLLCAALRIALATT